MWHCSLHITSFNSRFTPVLSQVPPWMCQNAQWNSWGSMPSLFLEAQASETFFWWLELFPLSSLITRVIYKTRSCLKLISSPQSAIMFWGEISHWLWIQKRCSGNSGRKKKNLYRQTCHQVQTLPESRANLWQCAWLVGNRQPLFIKSC